MTTERRRIRKRSDPRCGSVENERLVARGIGRSRKRGKALKREESRGPFVPPTVASRSPYLPPVRSRARKESAATRYEGLARRYAVYVTFARCKCVVPHAISWSNGPWCRASHNHARVLPALVPINTKRIERLSSRRIGSARGGARDSDSGERAKYRNG